MSTRPSTRSRALLIVGVCAVCLVACCGLAWWQWDRFTSVGGSFQNLGYVLQWPLFGLFPIYMFWRMRTLRQRAGRTPDGERGPAAPTRPGWPVAPAARRVPAVVPEHAEPEDEELAAYNAYLAELNARDQEGKQGHGDDRA